MGSENPFELPANAFDCLARALVANVRMEADPEHLPRFKSMRQHEQLGLGIGSSLDGRTGQPGVADLASVRVMAAVPRMALRPSPSLQVKEACRTDDDAVIHADGRERHRGTSILPG